MKTDTVLAYTLEPLDIIINQGETFTVIELVDDWDELVFRVEDDNGEKSDIAFAPFENVEILISVYDDGEEFEDVPIG